VFQDSFVHQPGDSTAKLLIYLLVGLVPDLGGDTIAILLPLARNLAAADRLVHLLNDTNLRNKQASLVTWLA
jgi:hypothetical protein